MEPIEDYYMVSGATTTYMDLVVDTIEYLNTSRNNVDLRTIYARKNLGLTNKKVHPNEPKEISK
jgi:hypothetical protein